MLTRDAAKHFFNAAQAFRQLADAMDGLHRAMQSDTGEPAAAPPAPGGAMTLEQFNAKVVSLIRDNPNRGPAAKQMLTRYAPNGGGAPAIDPAQYDNFIAELEAVQ
jgi:hypothetical protein